MFPTYEEVEAKIAFLTANPDKRPPSNDFCKPCLQSGMLHCSEVEYCGQREPYPSIEKPYEL